jgi:hypothetical protein
MGSPKSREAHGDGVPIVVSERERRSHGEGEQERGIPKHRKVREMRNAETVLGIIQNKCVTGELCAMKMARTVRRGPTGLSASISGNSLVAYSTLI